MQFGGAKPMRPFAPVVFLLTICIVPCAAQTTGNECAQAIDPVELVGELAPH
jgi:hypothetical protein